MQHCCSWHCPVLLFSACQGVQTADLLPEGLRGEADKLDRGTDTMDVWFDSGSSWAAVCRQTDSLSFPADLYMEGSDQHRYAHHTLWPSVEHFWLAACSHSCAAADVPLHCRGWFQSSLLTSVAVTGSAPYKQVLTHGFVLDEKGQKMSKSLGNVVDPFLVIDGGANAKKQPAYGADVLRLWVASVDYTVDVGIGDAILKQVFESYRKIRGTLRFLLGNVHDFDPAQHAVAWAELPLADRFLLHRLRSVLEEVDAAYRAHNFSAVYRAINVFVSGDLSSMYFELAKDRLYIRGADAAQRRSCQMVLRLVLCSLLAALAPITSHMCEDAWQHLPHSAAEGLSVFNQGLPSLPADELSEDDRETFESALAVKDVALKALEKAREAKDIGSPLDAHVMLAIEDPALREKLQKVNSSDNGVDALKYLFVTSQVSVVEALADGECPHVEDMAVEGVGAVQAGVRRADGSRCERCWHYCDSVGHNIEHPQVCSRCMPVVEATGFKLPAEVVTKQEVAV
jgi:isoleucyl-tRNA synthetase